MEMRFIQLSGEQADEIQYNLRQYNTDHISYRRNGSIQIGIEIDGTVVAGLVAYLSVYKILYVDAVFVEEKHRRKGYGKALIMEMERRARSLGVNTIRLDTFNWQGTNFYKHLGYEEVGHYTNSEDDFEESFFIKRI